MDRNKNARATAKAAATAKEIEEQREFIQLQKNYRNLVLYRMLKQLL